MKKENKTKRLGLVFAAMLLITAMLAIPAEAARAIWGTETILDPAFTNFGYPMTAINSLGTSVVAWDQFNANAVNQVTASVRMGNKWTPAAILSDPTVDSVTVGAVVTSQNKITVFFLAGGVGGIVYKSTYSNKVWSASQIVPSDAGYNIFVGAGADTSGNIEVVMASQSSAGAYNVKSLVKNSRSGWGAPVHINDITVPVGYPRFYMLGNGKGLLVAGNTSYRSTKLNTWAAPQIIPLWAGQIYNTAAALDTGGTAYFVFRTRYSGAFLTTSTPTTPWTTPTSISQFDTLGSDLAIVASSKGQRPDLRYRLSHRRGQRERDHQLWQNLEPERQSRSGLVCTKGNCKHERHVRTLLE